jgi:Flp pilus assembly pilin Flp
MFDRFYAWATALIAETKNESGQTLVEYALVLAVIVVALLLASTTGALQGAITGAYGAITGAFGG